MNNYDVVKKLIGNINPIGEANTDNERFENLKELCTLVRDLISEIDTVSYRNRDSKEFSVKRAGDYAKHFLTKVIGIEE